MAFIAGKYSLAQLPPIDVLSLRFLLAGILLMILTVIWYKGRWSLWQDKTLWWHGFILACLNYVLYLGLSYTGLKTVSPELVVLIVSTMPFVAHRHDVLVLTGVQNLLAGLILLPLSTPSLWAGAMSDGVFALSLWHQVILVSVVAMLMWFVLVGWFGSANASAFHLLNPIFATILAWWFFSSRAWHQRYDWYADGDGGIGIIAQKPYG